MKSKKVLQLLSNTPDIRFDGFQGNVCKVCHKEFALFQIMQRHALNQHNTPAVCTVCHDAIPVQYLKKQHKVIMHPECKTCKKVFDTPFSYYWHTMALHYEEALERPFATVKISGKPYWRCAFCSYVFYNVYSVHAHEKAVHPRGEDPYLGLQRPL